MYFSKLAALSIVAAFLLISCNPDEMPPETSCVQDALTAGILVVNEGAFTDGVGSLTVIDNQAGTLQNAFARNNCDSLLGNVVQSAAVIGDQIAVVVNNADKVVFLDAITMEERGVITGLNGPRYIVQGFSNLAYLSQWGDFGSLGSVVEVDVSSYTITRELTTGSGPEELQLRNGMLYVPHVGGFLEDDKVVVVNPTTMTVEKSIVTGTNPQSLVFVESDMWVINNGLYDEFDPVPGALVRVSEDDEIVESYETPFGSADLAYNATTNALYWLQFGNIYEHVLGSEMIEALAGGGYYDLTSHTDGMLYLCDAKDFNSLGELVVWDPATLSVQNTIPAGIIPGEVLFY